jgi:hypothetical protein
MLRFTVKMVSIVAGLSSVAFSQNLLPLARTAGADQGLGIPACKEAPGWYSLYDGTEATMVKYWFNASPQNHGINSRWWIDDKGVLNSGQSAAGSGGCIFTKHQYKNMEVKVWTKPHYGDDAGVFMRSNSVGRSYQMVVDYKNDKSLAGVYLEGITGPDHKGFYFRGNPSTIETNANWLLNGSSPERPKMTAADWTTKIWKINEFNWIAAKIYHDDVPFIDTYINGFPIVHYENPSNIAAGVTQTGYVALQVHNGNNWVKDSVNQYKAVLIRELKADASPLASYPEWTAACTTVNIPRPSNYIASPSISWRAEAGNVFEINGSSAEDYVLTLTNLSGKALYQVRGASGVISRSVHVAEPGVHLMTLRTKRHSLTYRIFQS